MSEETKKVLVLKANPDRDRYHAAVAAVAASGGYCPCFVQRNEDTRCPCKEFENLDHEGECRCGRYVKVWEEEE